MDIDAPPPAINEIERLERLNEDVVRYLTIRVDAHEEGPSAMMRRAERDRDRDDRRDRGDRGDRGGDRGRERDRRSRDDSEDAANGTEE
jgi:small subunit ribosomal protein S6